VLITHVRETRLASLTRHVVDLGHVALAVPADVTGALAPPGRAEPDAALVGIGASSERALELIALIVHARACPVISVLEAHDRAYIYEAAKRGAFAYYVEGSAQDLQSVLDISCARFARYHDLQLAFGRRSVTERAKGILMERHSLDEGRAFAMLRDHARAHELSLACLAQSVVDGDALQRPSTPAARVEPTVDVPDSARSAFDAS
jgi:response regulator NasT